MLPKIPVPSHLKTVFIGKEFNMNGAESLVRTLLACGVDTCFTNPGTSEMHFVAALDQVPGMRCVLALFEGVASGAADGYARMRDRPALTLFHCGPGLGNALANLHNARRARVPLVNIVGDQATRQRPLDPPLTADTEGFARPVSHWLKTCQDTGTLGQDASLAVQAALTSPGQIATLILPSDISWNPGGAVAAPLPLPAYPPLDPHALEQSVAMLRNGKSTLLLLAGRALREKGLALAAGIAARTGARLMAENFNTRMQRGRGRPSIACVPYVVPTAVAALAFFEQIILVGAKAPVGFFAYPDQPGQLYPPLAHMHVLARPEHDLEAALSALADGLGVKPQVEEKREAPALPSSGASFTLETIGRTIAALLPEEAIVVDESITSREPVFTALTAAAPYDHLSLMGGAIGEGLPMATGAAMGAPGRRVIGLQADGSALYTIQALWTQARERLDCVTLIFSNRKYAILQGELEKVGARSGQTALDMLSLDRPDIGWADIAGGFGVEAAQAADPGRLADLLRHAVSRPGPFLIELRI